VIRPFFILFLASSDDNSGVSMRSLCPKENPREDFDPQQLHADGRPAHWRRRFDYRSVHVMARPLYKLAFAARLIWLSLMLAYLGLQLGRHMDTVHGAIDWYLADVICLPLVLGSVLMAHRLVGQPATWILPRWHGAFAATTFAIYFEFLLPQWKTTVVADPRDAAAYFLGWALFELLINRPHKKSRDPKTAAFLTV